MRLSFDDEVVGIMSLCRYSHRSLAAVTFMLLAVLSPPAVEGQTDMPRVENVAFTDGLYGYKLDDIIEVTVTFSEEVAVTGTPQIALTLGSMTRQADYQSGPPSTDLVFRYTVADTDEAPETTIDANALKLNGGSIKKNNTDIDADLAHEAHEDLYDKRVDGITPVLWAAAVHGAHLVLTYSETLWKYSQTPASAYTVMVNNVRRDVSAVSISDRAVTLTLASAVAPTDWVTLSYQVMLSYTVGTRPIRDKAGNIVAALIDHAVTTSAPYVSSLEINSTPAARQTYAAGEVIELRVTFSESVTVTGTPHLLLTFDSSGPYERVAPYVTGSGTTALVFRYAVAEGVDRFTAGILRFLGYDVPPVGDEAPDGLSIAADALHLHDGTIRDSDNHDALLILDALTDTEAHKVDGVQPYLDFGNDDFLLVNGATLTVRYDEMLDESSVPASDAFAVTVEGVAVEVTDVSIADSTVTLTLLTPVEASDGVRLSYTAPDGMAATPVRDLVGNNAPDITDRLVRPPSVVVSFGAVRYEGRTATVTVKLDKDPERGVKILLTATNRDGITYDDYAVVPDGYVVVPYEDGYTQVPVVIFSRDEPLEKTFTVTVHDDAVADDAGELAEFGFGSPLPARMEVGDPATTVVTIAELTRPLPPPPPPPPPPGPGGGRGGGPACAEDVHGNSAAQATDIALDTMTSGAICLAADRDYFTVTAPGRGLVFVDTTGGVNLRGTIWQDGAVVATGPTGSRQAVRLGAPVQAGTVVVAVQGQGGATGAYELVVTFVPGYLENPGPDSFQSGVGVLSGWVCEAETVELVIDDTEHHVAAYGTDRADTQGDCGDTNNGFGLLFNWSRLSDGPHTVVALVDDVELDRATVTVTTLGQEFVRGVAGECEVEDFPSLGETVTLVWQESKQNFVIASGAAPSGENRAGAADVGYLENPGPNSFQSGIGVLSGWVCEAEAVEIEIGTESGETERLAAGYGTERADTEEMCGDTDNGFGLLFNWNRLRDGEHTVIAYVDNVELGRATVRVTTLGYEFLRGAEGECVVEDFPRLGQSVLLEWQQTSQNFIITAVE